MARPRTFDETEVLDGAIALFREQGYERTSVPELTERLGICRQSLYNAFGDKRGLYLRALERYGAAETDTKLRLLEADGSPLENVRTLVRGFAAHAAACPSDGCFNVTALVEGHGDADALEVVQRQIARLEDGFRDALDRARDRGEIRPDAATDRLARVFVTVVYGIGVLSRLPGSGPRIGESVALLLREIDAVAV